MTINELEYKNHNILINNILKKENKYKQKSFTIHFTYFLFLFLMLFMNKFEEMFIITFSILFHELGHVICAKIFKVRNITIELSMLGSISKMNLNYLSKNKKILVYSSGIINNLLLIILSYFQIFPDNINKITYHYNRLMFIFSLLPIYPLDGFNMINTYIQNNISFIISILSLIGLFVYAIINKSYGLLFICIFLLLKNLKKNQDEEFNKLSLFIRNR